MRTSFVASILLLTAGFSRTRKSASPNFQPPSVIGGGDVVYPLQTIASGTVIVEVSLDNPGGITGVRTVRGIPSLTEEAEHAVRQ